MTVNVLRTWIKNLTEKLLGGSSRRSRRLRAAAANCQAAKKWRPTLETLEDRLVPSSWLVADASGGAGSSNDITLPYAVANAQNGDTISFASSLSGATITLGSTLNINANVAITGLGAANLAISGNAATEVFKIESGVAASISNLTIEDGRSFFSESYVNGEIYYSRADGGGIYNAGNLSLNNCDLSGNTASSSGGAIYSYGGTLTVSNCTLSDNSAFSGGGIYGDCVLSVSSTTFSRNTAQFDGGGIANFAWMTAINCYVSSNSAASGGGIYNYGTGSRISNSTLSDNYAGFGGGIANYYYGSLTVSNSTLIGNSAGSLGGGIYNDGGQNNYAVLTVANSTLSDNSAFSGGGIWNFGYLTVGNSTLNDNFAVDFGGGIYNDSFLTNPTGYAYVTLGGTITLSNSTLLGNTAPFGGGGVCNGGDGYYDNASLTVGNCTLSGNSSTSGGGGGIYNFSGTLTLLNAIVAGNSAYNGPDAFGSINLANNSLLGNPAGFNVNYSSNNQLGGYAGLVALANNGGPTQTMALSPGSAAIGNGGALTNVAFGDPIGLSDTTIYVQDAAAIAVTPGDYYITIDSEQMLVTNVNPSNNSLTVVRGVNGTTAATHQGGVLGEQAGAGVYLATDQRGNGRDTATPDIGAFQLLSGPGLSVSAARTSLSLSTAGVATLSFIDPSEATPTGIVEFLDTTTNTILGDEPVELVNGNYVAHLSFANLALGTHVIEATYEGDDNFQGSSAEISLSISPAVQAAPATVKAAVWLDGVTDDPTGGYNPIVTSLANAFGPNSYQFVSTAELDTPGFLAANGFNVVIISRYSDLLGTFLDSTAAANIGNYVGLADTPGQGGVAIFTNDADDNLYGASGTPNDPNAGAGGDTDPYDGNLNTLFTNAVQFAANTGHGYIGEFNGAVMAMASNTAGAAPIDLLDGTASTTYGVYVNYPSPPFPAGEPNGNYVYTVGPIGAGNPIDSGVSFPFTDPDVTTFRTDITNADSDNIVDTYLDNGLPAVMANQAVVNGQPGEIGLSPAQDSKTVGQTETLTASVSDANGAIVGAAVSFTVISGPDAGVSGSGFTNSLGQTTFSFQGSATGVDVVDATFVDATDTLETSNDSAITWSAAVGAQAPVISVPPTETIVDGTAGSFSVSATGVPTPTFSASGLPAGVTLSPTTGLVSWSASIADSPGVFGNVTFTATNSAGSSSAAVDFTIDQAPSFTAQGNVTYTAGSPITNLTALASGYPSPTFSETGSLPSGLSFSSGGVLSGTPASNSIGTYPVTFTAANGISPNATETFSIIVTGTAPTFTPQGNVTYTAGSTITNVTAVASGNPAPSFSESGALPGGISFSNGVLSGTPVLNTIGVYHITFTAANGVAPNATETFTITVKGTPPSISGPSSITIVDGTGSSFALTSPGNPAPTFSATGLPPGVTINASSGVVSWPSSINDTPGIYGTATFTATNSAGSSTETATIYIDQAPAITSVNSDTFTAGSSTPFTVTTTGYPAVTFSETGALPGGVTLNPTTGVLSGAATAVGTFPITISATNGINPKATQAFTLKVTGTAPTFTSQRNVTYTVGNAVTLSAVASGNPAPTFSETGALPSGLSFSNGVISGTPASNSVGTYSVTFTAGNGVSPNATESFSIIVIGVPPVVSAQNSTTITDGTGGSWAATVTGGTAPITYSAVGLPAGVTINANNGVVSWNSSINDTPPAVQPTSATITATNSAGSSSQTVYFTIDQAPLITSATSDSIHTAVAMTPFTVTASGYPAATFTATGLPTGISLSASGVLSGTAPSVVSTTTYHPVFTATNGVNPHATQSFTLIVTSPQLLAGAENTNPNAQPLTQSQLSSTVTQAIQLWAQAGASPAQLALLRSTSITIGNLKSSGELADTTNGKIVIDATADGDGWYVSPNPFANNGFTRVPGTSEYIATSGPAAKEVDLLTVVLHELGHILGLPDLNPSLYPDDVMTETLAVGIRRLPTAADVLATMKL